MDGGFYEYNSAKGDLPLLRELTRNREQTLDDRLAGRPPERRRLLGVRRLRGLPRLAVVAIGIRHPLRDRLSRWLRPRFGGATLAAGCGYSETMSLPWAVRAQMTPISTAMMTIDQTG